MKYVLVLSPTPGVFDGILVYLGFCSIKPLREFLLLPGWEASPIEAL